LFQTNHIHPVQIYYEDTDHSGAVYHANFLRYFERAREHLLGVDVLVELLRSRGIGFVVYKAELTYKLPAHFGDSLEIHSFVTKESDYRMVFKQDVHRPRDGALLVQGIIQLASVDSSGKLVALPI